ncbi:MAG: FAD-dependent oxidoreductase [Longimicrobiales bacterium]|nr:FAD-dependent oxidoreductase [Longimicrobiales bacterium]
MMDRRKFLGVAGAGALGLGTGRLAGDDGVAGASRPSPAPAIHTRRAPEVLVIGAGVFGMFTAHYLREMGVDAQVVDQYGPGNSRATSGGETRGVRSSYGDRPHGPVWTRWALRAMEAWKAWDARYTGNGSPLFYHTGDLILREEMEPYLERTTQQWDDLGAEYEWLDPDEVRRRFPMIDNSTFPLALYEPGAGVVRARAAIQSAAEEFRRNGGAFVTARVTPGDVEGGRLTGVTTETGETLTADTYVFACGPWLPKLLPDVMGKRLRARSMGYIVYFGTPPGDHRYEWPNCPSYGAPGGTGWPAIPPDFRGFRARTGGTSWEDPDTSDRHVPIEGVERQREWVRGIFPLIGDQPVLETRACHYESSVDRNFIVDVHPGWENAWIIGGGSAEAFKQGPVLGEYIAHRLVGEDTDPEATEGFRLDEEEFEDEPGDEPGGPDRLDPHHP